MFEPAKNCAESVEELDGLEKGQIP